jgi:uncharacterized protein
VRVTLDTNVLIAAYVARGACHDLLAHCERVHQIVTSDFILDEFEPKLLRRFEVPPAKAREAAELARSHSQVVGPIEIAAPVSRDPDDDFVLAMAVAGACDCPVTGDKDLLTLKTYSGIPILPPQSFWVFEAEHGRTV